MMHCISLVLSRRLVAVLTSSAVTECDPVLLYNRLHVEYKGMATINLDNPSLEEISSTYKNIPEVDSKFQLKFVMFFGRHGARTPIRTLPNVEQVLWDKETIFSGAEHTEIDYEICSLDGGSRPEPVVENIYRKVILNGGAFGGQLTGVGMKLAYQLGQSLKSYYVDQLKFLSSEFTAKDIYIRSTNINRCIETGRCVIAGVYGKQLKSNSVEPLKVHVDHANREVLYPQEHLHPSLKQMWHQAQHAPDFIPGSAALIKKVKELLALPDDDKRIDLTGVKDDLSTRMVHGFPIPPQFGNDVIESLKEMSPKVLQYALGGPPGEQVKYLPISIGTLLHLIREVFQKLKEGKLKEKMQLYFCHDTTLTALLVALGIFDGDWPPLCCSISLEVYQGVDDKLYTRVLYRGKVQRMFRKADELLPFDTVMEELRPFSITWDEFLLSAQRAQEMR